MTQREEVLYLLREAKDAGVNSYTFTYSHSIKQAPTRIKELRLEGYNIISKPEKNRSVTYVLVHEKPNIQKENDFEWDFSTGIARRIYKQPAQQKLL